MKDELMLAQSTRNAKGAIAMLTLLLILGAMGGAISYVVWSEKQLQEAKNKD